MDEDARAWFRPHKGNSDATAERTCMFLLQNDFPVTPKPVSILSSMGLTRQKSVWQEVDVSDLEKYATRVGGWVLRITARRWMRWTFRVGLWDVKGERWGDAVQEDQKPKDLINPTRKFSLWLFHMLFISPFSTPRIHPPWVLRVGFLCSTRTQPEHEKKNQRYLQCR